MTKKHYIYLASVMNDLLHEIKNKPYLNEDQKNMINEHILEVTIRDICIMLKEDNPKFNEDIFYNACLTCI